MSSSCNKSNFQGNKFFHIFCPLDTYFYLHKNWNTYYISNSSSDTALLTLLEDPLMQDYKIHHLDNKSHHMYCLMDMLVCQAMAHNHWKTYLKYILIHFIKKILTFYPCHICKIHLLHSISYHSSDLQDNLVSLIDKH